MSAETKRLQHKLLRAVSQPIEPLTTQDLAAIEAELRRLAAVEAWLRKNADVIYECLDYAIDHWMNDEEEEAELLGVRVELRNLTKEHTDE